MFKDKKIISAFGLSSLFVILSFVWIFIGLSGKNGPFIVSFDPAGNINLKGGVDMVYGIVTVGLVILIMNLILSKEIYLKEKTLSYILGITSFLISGLLFVLSFIIVATN